MPMDTKKLNDFLGEGASPKPVKPPQSLEDFARGMNSFFIKFEESNPIVGTFVGYEFEDNRFKPGARLVQYHLIVDGMERILTSGSRALAYEMVKLEPKEGDIIKITRYGTLLKPTFKVEFVK